MRRACITGGAGFIGSNLADYLTASGVEVVVLDNFRTGRREFVEGLLGQPNCTLVEGDVLDLSRTMQAVAGCDWVFHLQANADVRRGVEHPTRDLEQNTIATSTLLEAMRNTGVRRIVFTSTGSVYGEPTVFPTPEDAPFPVQTSFYAASKLAGEGLASAYSTGFGFTAVICRLVSVLGERYTHGHVFDFYKSLRANPDRLQVLGDGRQRKSYVYVRDCVSALVRAALVHDNKPGVHIYNVGLDETITVDESVETICSYLGLAPAVEHTGGPRGWVGDNPLIYLDTKRLRSIGWRPTLTIRQAIQRTLKWLDDATYLWDGESRSHDASPVGG